MPFLSRVLISRAVNLILYFLPLITTHLFCRLGLDAFLVALSAWERLFPNKGFGLGLIPIFLSTDQMMA